MEDLLPYALCTYEDVKGYLVGQSALGTTSAEQKETIQRCINLFTAACEGPAYMNRELVRKERTVYVDLPGYWYTSQARTPWVRLAAPPVVETEAEDGATPPVPSLTVWSSSARSYTDDTLLTLYTHYQLLNGRNYAIIQPQRCAVFQGGPKAMKVTYTGGLIVPAELRGEPGQTDAGAMKPAVVPDDLRGAAAMQVATWWMRRKEFGVEAMAMPGAGSIALMSDPTKLLKHVRDVVLSYRATAGGF